MGSDGCFAFAVSLSDRLTLEVYNFLDHLSHSNDHIRSGHVGTHERREQRTVVIYELDVASTKSSRSVIHRPIVGFDLQSMFGADEKIVRERKKIIDA